MTTLDWRGVVAGLNAAFAARCSYVSRPVKVAAHSARVIYLSRHRG
jgi:hypothetical protein